MTTLFCPACELPNEPRAERCHACGTALDPEPASADEVLVQLEDRLTAMRNQLSDLEWRVQGSGWIALAVVVLAVLLLGPSVSHRELGDAVDCGSPMGALLGRYESSYVQTVWSGCAEAARPWLLGVALLGVLAMVGTILLVRRALLLAQLRSEVRRVVGELRAHWSGEDAG